MPVLQVMRGREAGFAALGVYKLGAVWFCSRAATAGTSDIARERRYLDGTGMVLPGAGRTGCAQDRCGEPFGADKVS